MAERERLEYVNYFYKISLSCDITYPTGEVITRDLVNFTQSIDLDYDYINARFPYLTLTLILRKDEFFFFQQLYKDTPVLYTLERGYRTDEEEWTWEYIFKEKIMSIVGVNNVQPISDSEGEQEQPDWNSERPLQMALFDVDHLAKDKELINKVYIDTDLEKVMAHLVFKYSKKIPLIAVMDNKEVYEQIFIPSMPLSQLP